MPGVDSVMKRGTFCMQAGNADFFRTYGTRILRCRAFDESDGAQSAQVVVVGERMAAVVWPSVDPLGKCVRTGQATNPCATVVGVAEEMHINSLMGQRDEHGETERDYTYTVPIAQFGGPAGTLLVRVAGDASVRIALGASRPHVVRLVVSGGVRLVIVGVALGMLVAYWAAHWIAPLLFQESATDPVVYGVVAVVLVGVALVARATPTFAASRVDPNVALRAD